MKEGVDGDDDEAGNTSVFAEGSADPGSCGAGEFRITRTHSQRTKHPGSPDTATNYSLNQNLLLIENAMPFSQTSMMRNSETIVLSLARTLMHVVGSLASKTSHSRSMVRNLTRHRGTRPRTRTKLS